MNKYVNKQIALLLGITCCVYLPIISNQFTFYSDDVYVLNNSIIQNLSWNNIKYIFTTYFDGHYHPLTLISLGITYKLADASPLLYQLTNLSFHLLSTFFVFVLIEKLFKNKQLAFIVALLFGVHTIHVESVARITERKDMQYAFFYLLSLIVYLKYIDLKKYKYLAFSFIIFILSLLSKGQAITLSFVLILIDIYYKRDLTKYQIWLEKIPFIALSIMGAFANMAAQKYTGYLTEGVVPSIIEPFINAAYVFDNYIFKLIIPINLSAQYDAPYINGMPIPAYLYLYLISGLSLVAYIIWKFRKKAILLFGILFYLVNIIMMLRWFDIAENFMPDRYNYIASIGFFIIIGVFYLDFSKKINYLKFIAIGYIGILCVFTLIRTTVWKDGLSVWEDAYNKDKNSATATYNYASNLFSRNDMDKTLLLLDYVNKIDSTYILANITRLNLYTKLNDSLNIITEKIKIFNITPKNSDGFANRGAIRSQIGDFEGTIKDINEAIKRNPNNAKLYFNKGNMLSMFGNIAEAIPCYDQAIKLKPYNIDEVLYFKSLSELQNNDLKNAIIDLKQAYLFNPNNKNIKLQNENIQFYQDTYVDPATLSDTSLLNQKGVDFYRKHLYYISINFFEQVLKLDPKNEIAIKFKIYCLYNFGQFKEAKLLLVKAKESIGFTDQRIEEHLDVVLKYKNDILKYKL